MRTVLVWCSSAVVDKAPLDLWPSAPIASSEVPKHPGLIQWLALADSKQCAPLVETCLSQLLCQDSDEAIHEAVVSPHLRSLIDGLRPETKTSIIFKMAGLPLGFQVPILPVEASFHSFGMHVLATDMTCLGTAHLIYICIRRVLCYCTGTYSRDH